MPIYEYKCSACHHELEALQKFADAPLVTCPACGKDALTKLVSAAGFQLKGSGWYQTDFKGSGAKPAAKGAPRPNAPRRKAANPTRPRTARRRTAARPPRPSPSRRPHPRHPAARPRRAPEDPRRSEARHHETLPDRGPAGVGAARHHDLGAGLPRDDAGPDAAADSGRRASRRAAGLPRSRVRRRAELRAAAADRRDRGEFLRRAADPVLGKRARPHSGRQVDLFVGEAGQRHAALRFGQRVPQGAARRISARRHAGRSRS